MSAEAPLLPTILWAQRDNCVFLTVDLSDVKEKSLHITPERFEFKGQVNGETPKHYAIDFDFYSEVNSEKIKQNESGRVICLCIEKKDPAYWPQLVKSVKKPSWLKTDFSKWRDPEVSDSEDEAAALRNFGDLSGANGNMQDMLKMMGSSGYGDLDDEDEGNEADADSDDDDLPDLEDPEKVTTTEPKESEIETKA